MNDPLPGPLALEFAVGATVDQARRAVDATSSEAAERQRVERTVRTQAIRALLDIYPTHSVNHIAATLGLSKNAVARELQSFGDGRAVIEPRTNSRAVQEAWTAAAAPEE